MTDLRLLVGELTEALTQYHQGVDGGACDSCRTADLLKRARQQAVFEGVDISNSEACPSISIVTGDFCSRPDEHPGLHVNTKGTQEWIDPLLDSFPNGVIVHGLDS